MIIEDLARNIVQTQFVNIDRETVERAKNRLIDIVGCTIGGARAPGCLELLDLIQDWGGKKEATILIHGGKVPAYNAAWINSIMARSYDFGVLTPYIGDKPAWSHISETTVPLAITAAEWQQASGRELLTALILGDDLTTRIVAATTQMISKGWDTPGVVDKFGAVAISGKLVGLNEHQLIEAFGMILNQLAGSFQTMQDSTHSFKLGQGLAARDGLTTVELAQKGWTGGHDALLGKFGYFALYTQKSDTTYLTRDLGRKFYGDQTFKPYPSCRFIHSSIECALKLVSEQDIRPENIAGVTINVALMHYDSPLNRPFEPGEFAQGDATFSLRYNVANVLIRKKVKLEHFTEKMIRDPEVGALARRIEVTDKMPPDKIEASEVIVRMKNGQEFSAYLDCAKGHPLKSPLSKKDIEAKFWDNVEFSQTISRENAQKVLESLNNLEKIDDIRKLVNLLVVEPVKT